ncbi:hypothetical protein N0V95_010040, partial [Ascochyta clinopodiicola]
AWAILAIRLFFAVNIVNALLPLVRRYYPDDIADIPLTPSQRTSMGLKASLPSSQTPVSAYASPSYVTPPRYARSTPRSSFSNQGERPLMGSGSPRASLGRSTSNSSYSPGNLGSSANKRASYGGGSPFNNSLFGESASSGGPGTPTPTPSTGKASVGLNNKWLYEKRRDSPRSGMFAYGWATLIAAGGGAYYFAKKSINADRASKAEADRQKRARQFQLEQSHGLHGASTPSAAGTSSNPTISPNAVVSSNTTSPLSSSDKQSTAAGIRRQDRGGDGGDGAGNPSMQASVDPAATRHAPQVEGGEKSKYEASDVYRTRKGDRFS